MHRRSDKGLDDLARMFNSHIRGWINYYGRFCPSALCPTLQRIDLTLARWASGKFKSLRGHKRRSRHWLARISTPSASAVCSLGSALWTRPNNRSRMMREYHVRF